ncbi:mast cell protease 1A-like [Chanos chanos]|uniref:trypsin n=1 Tax=Chanos chanos TaxID=29144 RepID=A0A6J2W9X5_CHACN|nr:mast cell protease 1A-like [Chanos chanos]
MANTLLILLSAVLPVLTLSASVNVGIINGTEAKPHSRPYMVSVQKDSMHICGGFLVSPLFVMSAAHCHIDDLTVVLGAHDLSDKKTDNGRVRVKNPFIHPHYNPGTFENDIMLLQLEKEVKLNQNVQLIPLPVEGEDVKPESVCTVAGWVATGNNKAPVDRLQEANVIVMGHQACQGWRNYFVPSSMICVGGKEGFCKGDSGGPLVCGATAVGVVSFLQEGKCEKPDVPNVYTKISAFLPWIKHIIGGTEHATGQ